MKALGRCIRTRELLTLKIEPPEPQLARESRNGAAHISSKKVLEGILRIVTHKT